jgi:hypothetical protein
VETGCRGGQGSPRAVAPKKKKKKKKRPKGKRKEEVGRKWRTRDRTRAVQQTAEYGGGYYSRA